MFKRWIVQYPVPTAFVLALAFVSLIAACSSKDEPPDSGFTKTVLFSGAEEAAPWAKFTGDLDRDGKAELYVGYHESGEVLQLAYGKPPDGPISRLHAVLTDGGIADLRMVLLFDACHLA